MIKAVCKRSGCEETFESYPSDHQQFCSPECGNKAKRHDTEKHCLFCGKFIPYRLGYSNQKYCHGNNRECMKLDYKRRFLNHETAIETREKIRKTLEGNIPWNKIEDVPEKICKRFGCNILLTRHQIVQGYVYHSSQCAALDRPHPLHSEKTKRKCRIIAIQKLKERGNIQPTYNPIACEYFKIFDNTCKTQGQYATNGGEYHIKGLGYFLDYINHDRKLIMEYDERRHYDCQGNLKAKDITRQKEIQEYFPDYEFIRIKEDEVKSA